VPSRESITTSTYLLTYSIPGCGEGARSPLHAVRTSPPFGIQRCRAYSPLSFPWNFWQSHTLLSGAAIWPRVRACQPQRVGGGV